jgi:hypothetical protein
LLDLALRIGGRETSYDGLKLRLECPDSKDLVVGKVLGNKQEVMELFDDHDDVEGFHLIEHILLRNRTAEEGLFMPVQLNRPGECTCVEVTDPYSYRATVLLPAWPPRFQDLKLRRFIEETLRREAPAHIYLKICWISHEQMKLFEADYDTWSEQLRSLVSATSSSTGSDDQPQLQTAYAAALEDLIERLHSLVSVFPLARLHDCREEEGEDEIPQVVLGSTSLGTA